MKRIPQTLNFDYELTNTTDAFFRSVPQIQALLDPKKVERL